MECPIASTPPPRNLEELVCNPRRQLGEEIFRRGLVAEFLLHGLIRHLSDDGILQWQLPEKGEAQESKINSISWFSSFSLKSLVRFGHLLTKHTTGPLHLAKQIAYPPTYQILGSKDELFEVAHAVSFGESLHRQGIPHKEHIVDGAYHAFDMWASTNDDIHLNVMRPAVDWIEGVINCQ